MALIKDDLKVAVFASMIATAALFLKFSITVMIQAVTAGKAGQRAPEDKEFGSAQKFGLSAPSDDDESAAAAERAARWKRIVLNDLESIPFSLLVIWATIITFVISESGNVTVFVVFVTIFVLMRILHSVAYGLAWKMARSGSFLLGTTCIFVIAITGVVAAFNLLGQSGDSVNSGLLTL